MTENASETVFRKILYKPSSVAEMLDCSESDVYELVKDGELIAHCKNGAGRKPMKITAESLRIYCIKYVVPKEKWME